MDLYIWTGNLIDGASNFDSFSVNSEILRSGVVEAGSLLTENASGEDADDTELRKKRKCLYLEDGCVYEATFSGHEPSASFENSRVQISTVEDDSVDTSAATAKFVYTPLAKYRVLSLHAGSGVFGVVTAANQAYIWGRSETGQCGIVKPCVWTPQRIRFVSPEVLCDHGARESGREMPAFSLAFSTTQCLAICGDDSLWCWGASSINDPVQLEPIPVASLYGRRVLAVSCGEQHYLALVATENIAADRRESCQSSIQELTISNYVDSCEKCQEERSRRRMNCKDEGGMCQSGGNLSTEVNADDGSFFCPLGLRLELSTGSPPGEDQLEDSGINFTFTDSPVIVARNRRADTVRIQDKCAVSLAGDIGISSSSLSRRRCRERGDIEMTEMRKAKSVGTRFSFTSFEFGLVDLTSSSDSNASDHDAEKMAMNGDEDVSTFSLSTTPMLRQRHGRSNNLARTRTSRPYSSTEVWSWGDNSKGQLGLGDFISRKEPTRVDQLTGMFITQLQAGSSHSLALSATGDIWAWGSNSFGQIKQANINAQQIPVVMKIGSQSCVLDAVAGPDFTVILVNTLDNRTDIYYCGRDYRGTSDTTTQSGVAVRLTSLHKDRWPVSLSSSNRMIFSATVDGNKSPLWSLVLELVCSEIKFAHRLKQLSVFANDLIRHNSIGDEEYGRLFRAYAQALGSFFTTVLERLAILKSELHEGGHVTLSATSKFFAHLLQDSFVTALKRLHSIYCQMTAFNVFSGVEFTSSLEKSLLDLSIANEVESSKPYRLLRKLFYVPFSRLDSYCKSAQTFMKDHPTLDSNGHDRLVQFVRDVKIVEQLLLNHYHLAENTSHFWSTCTGKNTLLSLRLANRFLVKEFTKMNGVVSVLENGSSVNWQRALVFSDSITFVLKHSNKLLELPLVWSVPMEDDTKHCIQLITPETTWTVEVVDGITKNDFIHCCNQAILRHQNGHYTEWAPGGSPALRRYGLYKFGVKHMLYGDAVYKGSWVLGKPHGRGELTWNDNRFFRGKFKDGYMNGLGELRAPGQDGAWTMTKGHWRDGRLMGLAIIERERGNGNGSRYEGYLKNGLRCGHGVVKGRQELYVGAWNNDTRHGYGVLDKRKEKYLGQWEMGVESGLGILVTLEGEYCQGTFDHGVFVKGWMTLSDGTKYEGEFSGNGVLNGKGTIRFSNGDTVTGLLHGHVNDQVKITNGCYKKCLESAVTPTANTWLDSAGAVDDQPTLPADQKWTDIFGHIYECLGIDQHNEPVNCGRLWENVVATLERLKAFFNERNNSIDSVLEKVPNWNRPLDESYLDMVFEYCSKAFSVPYHPLGRLLIGLTDVFNACYSGVGAHPELLVHAVWEVFSVVRRLYDVIRYLFPSLPPCSNMDNLIPEKSSGRDNLACYETYGSLFHDTFLQLTYPNLFTLYVLRNEQLDRIYWEKISSLNLKNDVALLDCLGVCNALWPIELKNTDVLDAPMVCATARKKYYADAIYCLQRLSSEFYPSAKLRVIVETFDNISKCVSRLATESENQHTWTADSLVPVTTYVIVRAQIQRLGAEIQLTENFSPQLTSLGEVQYMFTMLQGCYQHIVQNRSFC